MNLKEMLAKAKEIAEKIFKPPKSSKSEIFKNYMFYMFLISFTIIVFNMLLDKFIAPHATFLIPIFVIFAIIASLVLILIVALVVYNIWYSIKNKPQSPPPIAENSDEEQEVQAAEQTYINITPIIREVGNKIATVISTEKAAADKDIQHPKRAFKSDDIYRYHYSYLLKGNATPDILFTTFSNELKRTLYANEATGISSNLKEIDGVEYPALMLDKVEIEETHVVFAIVITTKKFLSLYNKRNTDNYNNKSKTVDVADDEFI